MLVRTGRKLEVYIPMEQNSTDSSSGNLPSECELEDILLSNSKEANNILLGKRPLKTKGKKDRVPRMIEHASMIQKTIQCAEIEKKNQQMICLDLVNAYKSISCQCAKLVHRVSYEINNDRSNDKVTVGCTISLLLYFLFILVMQVILKSMEGNGKGLHLGDRCYIPPNSIYLLGQLGPDCW